MIVDLPLMRNVLTSFIEKCSGDVVRINSSCVSNICSLSKKKKTYRSRIATLIISKHKMMDIMEIAKSLE